MLPGGLGPQGPALTYQACQLQEPHDPLVIGRTCKTDRPPSEVSSSWAARIDGARHGKGQGRGLRIWAEALEGQATGLRRKGSGEGSNHLPSSSGFSPPGGETDKMRSGHR